MNTQERIENEVKTQISAAEVIFSRKYEIPKIEFNLRGKNAGQYRWDGNGTHTLRFNVPMAELNSDKYFDHTPVHEVAHYVANINAEGDKIQPHGFEWKDVMNRLGFRPTIYHKYEIPPKPVKVEKKRKRKLPVGVYKLMRVKSREQAKEDGDILYWGGKKNTCPSGHKAPRYTRDNVCKECYRIKRKAAEEKRIAKLVELATQK